MGDLPLPRTSLSFPVQYTGNDFAGPFTSRVYLCMATKAVHLELAQDLSTTAFLDALRHFVSFGHLDCGTNYVWAAHTLNKQWQSWISQPDNKWAIDSYTSKIKINFHFNPRTLKQDLKERTLTDDTDFWCDF